MGEELLLKPSPNKNQRLVVINTIYRVKYSKHSYSLPCLFSKFSLTKYYNILGYITYFRYDKKDTSRLTLFGMQLITAMSPPGGGRNPVTSRFLRHFNIIGITSFSDETMTKIFGSIITHSFRVSLFYVASDGSCFVIAGYCTLQDNKATFYFDSLIVSRLFRVPILSRKMKF